MILPIEQQYTSLEISKRLKELGVRQDLEKGWIFDELNQKWEMNNKLVFDRLYEIKVKTRPKECFAAYSVAEIGELMQRNSHHFPMCCETNKWCWSDGDKSIEASTEADCRGLLLIHLIEKRIIKL